MKKNLHSFLFSCSFILFLPYSFAQQNRSKLNQKQIVIQYNKETNLVPVNNIIETQPKAKSSYEVSENVSQLKSNDSISLIQSKNKITNSESKKTQVTSSVNSDISISSFKENLAETPVDNNISERKAIKVQRSVNYKPTSLKEDLQPLYETANPGISSNKRIYLQQEADDLQVEIKQNEHSPNYDLAKKQKQLDDIKKILLQ